MQQIPFELVGDHVVVRASLAGTSGAFIVDTGSGATSLDAAFAASLGIEPEEGVQVQGAGAVAARLATLPAMGVGSLTLEPRKGVLVPFDGVSEAAGFRLRGTLGYDFFAGRVVDFDYAARTITLHDAAWSYEGAGAVVPVSLQYRIPIVTAAVVAGGTELTARFALDLGSSQLAVRLLGAFAAAHAGVLEALPGVDGVIGTGVGGVLFGRIARLDELRLGTLRVAGPTLGWSAEARGVAALSLFDGTIGSPLFARTRLILDYPRQRVILEPREGFHAPYEWERSGMHVALRGGRPAVTHVIDGSPAAEAGIMVGDEIVTEASLPRLREWLRRPDELRLTIRRGDATREVAIQPRRLI